jgi:hypothetical protein
MDALKDTYFHKTILSELLPYSCLFKKFYLHSPNSKVVDASFAVPHVQPFGGTAAGELLQW